MEKADAVIIGSGQGGIPLAVELARRGQRVILFERAGLGGSCVNYGCIPSKAFLASAHAAAHARYSASLGVHAQVKVDFQAVMERVRSIIRSHNESLERTLDKTGVRLVRAEASFRDEHSLSGGGVTVQAPLVVINSGKSPFVPGISGLEGTPYLTYTKFWDVHTLPRRTLIMGGGYVGLELGQGLARLGSQVQIIESNDRIAVKEEVEVSQALAEALKKDDVQLHLGVEAIQVDHAEEGFTLTLSKGGKLEGDALLVSTGQRSNTAALNAAAAGIELDDQGNIIVDKHFRTTNAAVYAIGDVTGQPAFTHVSWEDYRRLIEILDGNGRTQGDRVLGYGFLTEPQVGRAGLTLAQAREKGFNAREVTLPLERVARAEVSNRTLGFYRMVIDQDTDKILGATLVGAEAAELIHVFIAHMEAGSTWQTLDRSVHIHPTYAEGLPSLARLLREEI
ncbi:MAG: dihydrolipoyl dehydrogenase family protein [Acidobacteriota bacterium]